MVYVDESNKIKYSFNTIFQKKLLSYLRLLSSFNLVLFDLISQILIFDIHHCSEKSHISSRVLSIVLVYQKVIIWFFKLYFFCFVVFCRDQHNLSRFIGYLHCSLVLRIIMHSIDSNIPFDSHKFVFELSSSIGLVSIRKIMCDDAFFRLLRWSQLSI